VYYRLLINFSDLTYDTTECRLMTQGELKIQICKDSIPVHRIKATRYYLRQNMPDFVSS